MGTADVLTLELKMLYAGIPAGVAQSEGSVVMMVSGRVRPLHSLRSLYQQIADARSSNN